jgi:hypothetical protein
VAGESNEVCALRFAADAAEHSSGSVVEADDEVVALPVAQT